MRHLLPFLISLFTMSALADTPTQSAVHPSGAEPQPNIVLILADDLGYGDCSLDNPNSKIKTPHLEQLAREGLLFTDAHAAASTCTPSRYGLLTGINPVRTHVKNTLLKKGKPIISKDEKTIAQLLQDHGYLTRMIGKWHLGFEMDTTQKLPRLDLSQPLKGGPLDRGFHSFFGIHSSAGSSPVCFLEGRHAVSLPTDTGSWQKQLYNGKNHSRKFTRSPGLKLADVSPTLCQKAVQAIHDHANAKNTQPLFLYYASPIPHQPWVPTSQFKGKSGLGDYGDFLLQFDHVVGQINTALKESGLAENTLLIFTSDNGTGPAAHRIMAQAGHPSSGPYRGMKADIWEGGHRVPFIVKWPSITPAGQKTNALINFTDLYATLTELLNKDPASTGPDLATAKDSHSFLPILKTPSTPHSRPVMINGFFALRQDDWKLVTPKRNQNEQQLTPQHFELYNLTQDPAEKTNLALKHPKKVTQLYEQFKAYAKQLTTK